MENSNTEKDSKCSLDGTPIHMTSTFDSKPKVVKKTSKLNKNSWNKEHQNIMNIIFQQYLKFHDRAYHYQLEGQGRPLTFSMFKNYALSKYDNETTRVFATVVIESIQVLLKN